MAICDRTAVNQKVRLLSLNLSLLSEVSAHMQLQVSESTDNQDYANEQRKLPDAQPP